MLALLSLVVQRPKHRFKLGGELSQLQVLELDVLFTGDQMLVFLPQLSVSTLEFVRPLFFLVALPATLVLQLLDFEVVLLDFLFDCFPQVLDLKALL